MNMSKLGPVYFAATHTGPGGIGELWSDLASGLRARGVETRLMAFYPEGSELSGWDYVLRSRPGTIFGWLGLFIALVKWIKRERPSLVVTAMPTANAVMPFAMLASQGQTRALLSHHTPVQSHQKLIDAIDSVAGRLDVVKSVIAVSAAVRESLHAKPAAYQAKVRTIHNALPAHIEAEIAGLSANAGAEPESPFVAVAIGRLSKQKNHEVLVRAASNLRDVSILIAGDGPEKSRLHDRIEELNVASRVRLVGELSRKECLALLSRAIAFVQPSRYEGHSLALIEAAKLGIPLLVSDVPSQVEGVTRPDGVRCGIIVGLDDDFGFAEEISKLARDPSYFQSWSARSKSLGASISYDRLLDEYMETISNACVDEVLVGA